MKTLLFLLALPLVAQTTVVTVPFTLPNPVVVDALAWGRTQLVQAPVIATLTGPMLATDAMFTISATSGYSATDTFANAGGTLLIDNEEILCTAFNSTGIYSGCTHAQQGTSAAAHSAGAVVRQLMYATNSSLLKALLLPGLLQAIQSLGASSTYLGSLETAQATALANLNAALNAGTLVK